METLQSVVNNTNPAPHQSPDSLTNDAPIPIFKMASPDAMP